jgi:hypothetical protein
MNPRAATLIFVVNAVIFVLTSTLLPAQDAKATLSGIVTDSVGKAVPNAKVSIKNTATGESRESLADSEGHYSFPNLAAGDYEVSISAEGIGTGSAKATLAASFFAIAQYKSIASANCRFSIYSPSVWAT